MAPKHLVDLGHFFAEVLRPHSGTPQFVGLLWTSDRAYAETFYLTSHISLKGKHQCSWRDSN